jgi:adenine/guanine phosphoribosyltransferase-like PRPP-binding protein
MEYISEPEFRDKLSVLLNSHDLSTVRCVTGPGRSGAIASVYTSHILGVPFVPYSQKLPEYMKPVLIIDTAHNSGRTLRRAERKYQNHNPIVLYVIKEPPRRKFFYEN